MMRNTARLLLSLALVVTTTAARASEVDQLKEQIKDCEATLDVADKVIKLQSVNLDVYADQNLKLQQSLDYATSQLAKERAWYNDPKVMAPIAFVMGVALGAYVTKQAR